MVVTPHVARQVVDNLHERLTKIYLHYSLGVVTLKEHTKLPCIVAFMDTYVVSSPYSFSIRKCGVVSCCGQIHSPEENGIGDMVMQRQMAPCTDVDKVGHFMHRDDALREASVNKSLFVDLSDLPSSVGDPKKSEAKEWAAHDVKVTKKAGLRYWESKKVWGFLVCYHCGKRHCIYSPHGNEHKTAQLALQQKLKSMCGRFSCGSLLFDDGHHLSRILVQKTKLDL